MSLRGLTTFHVGSDLKNMETSLRAVSGHTWVIRYDATVCSNSGKYHRYFQCSWKDPRTSSLHTWSSEMVHAIEHPGTPAISVAAQSKTVSLMIQLTFWGGGAGSRSRTPAGMEKP